MIIKGYRGSIGAEESKNLASQGIFVFNAMCVGGREHCEFAYTTAERMFSMGKNIAMRMHIEMMLILSGKRQISEALKLCSSEGADGIVAVSRQEFDLPMDRDDSVIQCTAEKLKYLGIKSVVKGKECDAFFENSAMLNLER